MSEFLLKLICSPKVRMIHESVPDGLTFLIRNVYRGVARMSQVGGTAP